MKYNFQTLPLEKIKADVVLSLGSNCRVAHYLRKHHLRLWTSPLDWMLHTNLECAYELFKNGFKNFFTDCSLEGEIETSKARKKLVVKDNQTGMVSLHHFFAGENLEIQAQRIREQTLKRWEIMKNKLSNSQNIILIFTGVANLEELTSFLEKFCSLDFMSEARGGGIILICISNDKNLKADEITMQKTQIAQNKIIFEYFLNEENEDALRGNALFWDKLMKSIQMSQTIKFKNALNDFRIRFLRSCKKRIAFFTKSYKNDINETH